VYPQFRGLGLGGLLEHFWWAYLDSQGYSTGFMRMELDRNQTLVEQRLNSGYCRRETPEELGEQFSLSQLRAVRQRLPPPDFSRS
jgi:hypothetical protein